MGTPRRGCEKFSGNTFQAYLSGLDAMGPRPVVRLMVPEHVKRMMLAVVVAQGSQPAGPSPYRPRARLYLCRRCRQGSDA